MSVKNDVYAYVAADTILMNLLGADSSDSKIYPHIDPGTLPPHIVYWRAGEGDADDILDSIRIVFKITVPDYNENLAEQIRERLNALLDFKQGQSNLNIPSAEWDIYNSEKNGGSDEIDDTTKEIIKVVNYDVLFTTKTF